MDPSSKCLTQRELNMPLMARLQTLMAQRKITETVPAPSATVQPAAEAEQAVPALTTDEREDDIAATAAVEPDTTDANAESCSSSEPIPENVEKMEFVDPALESSVSRLDTAICLDSETPNNSALTEATQSPQLPTVKTATDQSPSVATGANINTTDTVVYECTMQTDIDTVDTVQSSAPPMEPTHMTPSKICTEQQTIEKSVPSRDHDGQSLPVEFGPVMCAAVATEMGPNEATKDTKPVQAENVVKPKPAKKPGRKPKKAKRKLKPETSRATTDTCDMTSAGQAIPEQVEKNKPLNLALESRMEPTDHPLENRMESPALESSISRLNTATCLVSETPKNSSTTQLPTVGTDPSTSVVASANINITDKAISEEPSVEAHIDTEDTVHCSHSAMESTLMTQCNIDNTVTDQPQTTENSTPQREHDGQTPSAEFDSDPVMWASAVTETGPNEATKDPKPLQDENVVKPKPTKRPGRKPKKAKHKLKPKPSSATTDVSAGHVEIETIHAVAVTECSALGTVQATVPSPILPVDHAMDIDGNHGDTAMLDVDTVHGGMSPACSSTQEASQPEPNISLDELGDFQLPFDDVANDLPDLPCSRSGTVKKRAGRRRRVSAADMEVMQTVAVQSPDTSMDGLVELPVPTPDRRRSRRIRRKSIELYKVALEHRKNMEEAQSALVDSPEEELESDSPIKQPDAKSSSSASASTPPTVESGSSITIPPPESSSQVTSLPSESNLPVVTSPQVESASAMDNLQVEMHPASVVEKTSVGNVTETTVEPTKDQHDENCNVCDSASDCDKRAGSETVFKQSDVVMTENYPNEQTMDQCEGHHSTSKPSQEIVAIPGGTTSSGSVNDANVSSSSAATDIGLNVPSVVVSATKEDDSTGVNANPTDSNSRLRRRRASSSAAILAIANMASPPTPKAVRGTKRKAKESVEDIYLNKLWKSQMPKDRTWETIYETPQISKKKGVDSELLLSTKKFKRSVEFETQHTAARMRRRRQKAMKLGWRPSTKKKQAQLTQMLDERLDSLARDLEFESSSASLSLSPAISTDVEMDDVFYTPEKGSPELPKFKRVIKPVLCEPLEEEEDVFKTPLKAPQALTNQSEDSLNSSGESTDSFPESGHANPAANQIAAITSHDMV